MDALSILPLWIVPLRTDGLAHSRLVKNNRLEGVLELYSAEEAGSGHVTVSDLPRHYGWPEGIGHPDFETISVLAELPSYDVYSLRRTLRDLGIPVNNYNDLRLSDEKNRELTHYMTKFTLPLLKHIYGEGEHGLTRFEDLVALFKDPDEKRALSRLKLMAQKLNVTPDQIPRFIEDYGDVFLSLSYYYHCRDRLEPLFTSFTLSMKDMRSSLQVRHNAQLMAEMHKVERQLAGLLAYLKHVFATFDRTSSEMWQNLSAVKFRAMQSHVHALQTRVGCVLCGLTVKMNAWAIRFPNPIAGGPAARAEFIMSDMRDGLSEILNIVRQPVNIAATGNADYRRVAAAV